MDTEEERGEAETSESNHSRIYSLYRLGIQAGNESNHTSESKQRFTWVIACFKRNGGSESNGKKPGIQHVTQQ
jgi:hypothetical protein